jgi:hypothetical protein
MLVQDVEIELVRPLVLVRLDSSRGTGDVDTGDWALAFVVHQFRLLGVELAFAEGLRERSRSMGLTQASHPSHAVGPRAGVS